VSVLRHLGLTVEDRGQRPDTGVDDHRPKPFSFSELSARIRALLRRSHPPSESVLVVEDLKLDHVERCAERAERRIELTSKEFALLEYLMRDGSSSSPVAGRTLSGAVPFWEEPLLLAKSCPRFLTSDL
jgi:hypothetical protein